MGRNLRLFQAVIKPLQIRKKCLVELDHELVTRFLLLKIELNFSII